MIWRALALVLIGCLSGVLGLWISDRDPPVTQVREREVLTPIVEPGGKLLVRFHLLRKRTCETYIERFLYDGADVRSVLPDQSFKSPPVNPGPEMYVSRIDIPEDASPGYAKYRWSTTFTCNPVHRFFPIVSPINELTFQISPPDSPP
jgi:hypothetical protein